MPDVTIDLPVLAGTGTAPAWALTADVTFGLPTLSGVGDVPAVYIGAAPPRNVIVATVYGIDARTFVCRLPIIRNQQWQEVLSEPGSATFEVPLAAQFTSQLVDRRIVKLSWLKGGKVFRQFACRLDSEKISIPVDDNRWVTFADQPGAMCLVGDAFVDEEYKLGSSFSSTRWLGYMSANDFWQVPGQYVTPQGTRWDHPPKSSNAHYKNPPEFSVDPSAEWIGRTNPNTTQPNRRANYFIGTFYVDQPTDVQVIASGDNYLDLYLAGNQLFNADYSKLNGWTTAQSTTVRVPAGEHIVAARVENGPLQIPPNPVAFICTVQQLDHTGKAVGTLLHTNTTDWVVADDSPEPGWHRGQVLLRLLLEAQEREVHGPLHINIGFTYDRDSSGQLWTDRGNYDFEVTTVNLVDVIAQLTEADMDVTFNSTTMTLHAWRRAGRDRYSTVELSWGEPDGSLLTYDVETKHSRFNALRAQLSTGEWIEQTSAASIALVGRVEAGLSLGSTVTDPSARGVMAQQINESATPHISVDAKTHLFTGPQPFINYDLGDSLKAPNNRDNGTMKARVMSITVAQTKDTVEAWPQLVQDLT